MFYSSPPKIPLKIDFIDIDLIEFRLYLDYLTIYLLYYPKIAYIKRL
jgi:hypothetical protein